MGRGVALNDLDHRSIVALSQSCTEDLDVRMREKHALTKLLAELKKKKLQYDSRVAKKKREVDSTIVQTMELEKKLQMLQSGNKMMAAEVQGFQTEKERLEDDVERLR